jgi:hypothetical protein
MVETCWKMLSSEVAYPKSMHNLLEERHVAGQPVGKEDYRQRITAPRKKRHQDMVEHCLVST